MHRPSLVLSVSMLALAVLASAPLAWAQADAGDTTDSGVSCAPRPPRPPAHPDTPTIIPHNLEGRADCIGCHGPAGKHPFPGDHRDRPSVACLACHVPSQSSRAQVPNTPVPPAVTNDFCLACHSKPGLKMKLPSGQELALFIDKDTYAKAMHGCKQMSCTACHPSNQTYPHEPFKGQVARELNRSIVQERCAACHAELFAKYKESVHGKALLEEGNLDVPSCTDCHGIHNMRDPETVLFRVDSPDTCSKCHSDAKLMGKYGISPNVAKTYLADFHGTTVRLDRKGNTPEIGAYKAVCYDCHGIHDIKKTDDPTSRVVKAHLVETCRRCHANAGTNFPAAWTAHYEPDRKNKWSVVYWVNFFYKLAIPGILGGMGFYISLELAHEIVVKWKRWRQQ